jgi:hypothetical protein
MTSIHLLALDQCNQYCQYNYSSLPLKFAHWTQEASAKLMGRCEH